MILRGYHRFVDVLRINLHNPLQKYKENEVIRYAQGTKGRVMDIGGTRKGVNR